MAYICIILLFPAPSSAAKVAYFMNDSDLRDSKSMSEQDVERFLLERGALASITVKDLDGTSKTPAAIISRVAKQYLLNPKFIIALLQREQSLIEDRTPSQDQLDWAVGYGVCDSCSKDDPRLNQYKGFAKQLDAAAQKIIQDYLPALESNGKTASGFGPGLTARIDGETVTIANKATALLLTYTPHFHGNYNFRSIWQRYFEAQFPDGSLLQVKGNPDVWAIQYGRRRYITSAQVLFSLYNGNNIIPVSQVELESHELGTPMRFNNFAILQATDSKRYVLVDGVIRPIEQTAFESLNVKPEQVHAISNSELADYPMGTTIESQKGVDHPELVMAKNRALYRLAGGELQPIISREIVFDHFGKSIARALKSNEKYPIGKPVVFRDGALIKARGKPAVYLISNGVRRLIPDEKTFRAYGFDFRRVIQTSPEAVDIHLIGNPLITNSREKLAFNLK